MADLARTLYTDTQGRVEMTVTDELPTPVTGVFDPRRPAYLAEAGDAHTCDSDGPRLEVWEGSKRWASPRWPMGRHPENPPLFQSTPVAVVRAGLTDERRFPGRSRSGADPGRRVSRCPPAHPVQIRRQDRWDRGVGIRARDRTVGRGRGQRGGRRWWEVRGRIRTHPVGGGLTPRAGRLGWSGSNHAPCTALES